MAIKIGVILSGCGFLDGAEIRESVLTLLAIDRLGAEAVMMAPDIEQYQVIDHLNQSEMNEKRNVLLEAARIARGDIKKIDDVDLTQLDALVMPGGFGAAKNLSTLAFEGPKANMERSVKDALIYFRNKNKPIGAICISPAVICLAIGEDHPEVTIGNDSATAEAITALGGRHIECAVHEAHVDRNLKIATTPAYMYDDAPLAKIAQGIEACVQAVVDMIND